MHFNKLSKFVTALALAAGLQACGAAGLLPSEENGAAVTIPRVILNCQTTKCRTNATAPVISTFFTKSACSDAYFGAVISSTTRAINCSSVAGCYGDTANWQSSTSAAGSLNEGNYNICSCIQFSSSAIPWTSCDVIGSKSSIDINSTTGLQTVSSWADQ